MDQPDAVEAALAGALGAAAGAGRWEVVEVLARELEARRTAMAGASAASADVVDLAERRRGRA